jgi:beta-ketodecanoyl-[acyl-carrier-protein] synthase
VRAYPVGKASMAPHDGGLALGTQVLLTRHAEIAMAATAAVPSQPHALTDAADEIAAGVREPLTYSSVEFIEKASGIQQRYVLEKSGVLDPSRMYPRFTERPDDQLSLMAEIAVDAARKALDAAGKTGDQIDAVLCSAANMQRAYPAMAIEIQQALGASGYGFDMNVACSSATFAIEQAVNAVRTGSAKCVLVVNPEITSGHHEWNATVTAISSLAMSARR